MKKSLTTRIIFIISGLVAGAIVFCLLLNFFALEKFYTYRQEKELVNVYEIMSDASEDGKLYDSSYSVTFENLSARGNMRIMVLASDGTVLQTNVNDRETLRDDFAEIMFGQDDERDKSLEETDEYSLMLKFDRRLNQEHLVLWGTLEDGNLVLIRTPLESIQQSARIASVFLLIVGLIAIAVSIIVGIVLSRRITRPIQTLQEISKRMVDLDFEAKYQNADPQGDEIDQLGDHMNRLSETLEGTISELKSANVELQKDIDQKTEIDEMRKEFLSNVSHELKTPLALIQGYAEGLQMCINDDQESRDYYCEVIIDEADKMNRMVKKLLTLNQLEFGNEQVVMERFDISELVRGVTNATAILRDQNGIRLEMDIPDETYVWGDEFKIEEVVTNYMSNAINHCEGEKVIRISYSEPEDALLRVSVFNTGQPIPEEDLEQIWIKFYKVDKARTRAYGGSGIGLSIVKAIMDSMNQKCGVVNRDDGVEFWFELSR
ncbi:MAG: HAMP domain-containing protein [Lachnospiraceae bacterium]|nr:HAMP domain-containing protein [Lachnospiraceae bacterium]